MKKERRPRVSLCMIVKNEEEKLQRALAWGRGILWERIVVDTGSVDRTVELAKRFGAKVFYFEWVDDFSAARNFALDQASGDWILMLDADEYPVPGIAEKLFYVLEQAEQRGAEGVFGEILDLNEQRDVVACGSRIFLFRNTSNIRYYRRVHEQLRRKDGCELHLVDAGEELAFFHDGYVGKAQAEKKRSRRNLVLLEKELSERPDDYEIMGYIGDEYKSFGDTETAVRWYRRSVEHMPKVLPVGDPRSARTFSSLISLYAEKEEYQEAERMYQEAVRRQPFEADYDYQMGCFSAAEERWEDGIRYLTAGLDKLEKHGTSNSCMQIRAALEDVYGNLALCFLRSGRRKEAVETAVVILKVRAYDMRALYILLSAFFEDGGDRAEQASYLDSVAGFLGKLYRLSDLKDCLFIARAAKEAGWEAMRIRMEGQGK